MDKKLHQINKVKGLCFQFFIWTILGNCVERRTGDASLDSASAAGTLKTESTFQGDLALELKRVHKELEYV